MKLPKFQILQFIVIILFASGCNFFESTDYIPMYLSVNEADLEVRFNEGAATHSISDVWVFVDGDALGVFEMPVDVPMLDLNEDGVVNVDLFGGVRNNGINSDAIIYPFYKKKSFEFDFKEEQFVSINPEYQYDENLVFGLIEDFENGNTFVDDLDGNPETKMVIEDSNAATGIRSGRIDLPQGSGEVQISTSSYLRRADISAGSRVFLEIDYLNDIELQIGVATVEDNFEFSEYVVVLLTQDDWNKVYIELTNQLARSNIELYRILIGAVNPTEEDKRILIDNVKLLHF